MSSVRLCPAAAAAAVLLLAGASTSAADPTGLVDPPGPVDLTGPVDLPRLADVAGVGRPRRTGLARLRSLARFVPVHRMFHSVEMTMLAFVAAVLDAAVGGLAVTRGLLLVLAVGALVTVVGHVAAILSSSKLRAEG